MPDMKLTREEVEVFNKVSRKLCDELSQKDKCGYCPFYQWDTYYNCFNEDGHKYPLIEIELNEIEVLK